MSAKTLKRSIHMFQARRLCFLLLIGFASVSGQLNRLALDALEALAAPSSPVAVIFFPGNKLLLGNLTGHFPVPVTTWNCMGRHACFMKLKRYVTQDSTAFPRPGVVLAQFPQSQRLRAFVTRFQKYHSYIQWIFPVRGNEDILQLFNGHVCQVTAVTDTKINVPSDGYRNCATRKVLTTTQDYQLKDPVPPAGIYSKNELIRYAIDDASSEVCFRYRGIVQLFEEVYRILNNTFEEVCNRGDTDSLLLDRRVDFVLSVPDRINPGSYYGYVTMPLISLCFITRWQGPTAPSFASAWLSFFALFLIVAPLAVVVTLILRIRTQRRQVRVPDPSDLILFFWSTYLGRCPPLVLKSISASARVATVTWMFGTFFLVQFTQTNITASRNVPSHSPQVRRLEELVSRLDDGSMAPCSHFMVARAIEKYGSSAPRIASVIEAIRKCGQSCRSANIEHDCIPRALNGAHVVVHRCRTFKEGNVMSTGLVVGDDRLLTYPYCMPTHTRYPQRNQHRRLLLMFEESGLLDHGRKKMFPPCTQCSVPVSFEIPFRTYFLIFIACCCLSLLAFCIELTYKR